MHSSTLDQARSWASSLWLKATSRWAGREGQDRNYRTHVVHPAFREMLRERFPDRDLSVVDLGCGDGAFLDDPGNRELIGTGGVYCGVDVAGDLIMVAKTRHTDVPALFIEGDILDHTTTDRITKTGVAWDAALSVFVVQEMPDATKLLDTFARIVRPGGIALMLTVHPSFGDWLREQEHMTVEENMIPGGENAALWRWAGRYPIVDEPREPFYLPYFHRTLEDYREVFRNAGFYDTSMIGIPDGRTRSLLNDRGISPFVPSETNVYWPRMIEAPSALLVAAVKGPSL